MCQVLQVFLLDTKFNINGGQKVIREWFLTLWPRHHFNSIFHQCKHLLSLDIDKKKKKILFKIILNIVKLSQTPAQLHWAELALF